MRIRSKTLFSKLSLPLTDEFEAKKISYWLEKLFHQEEKRQANEKQEIEISPQEGSRTIQSAEIKKTLHEKGIEESSIATANKKESDRKTLENMVVASNRILISASSVFPWDFFPTKINVESKRVTIVYHQLFSSQSHSIDIKDISNVFIDSGILFAQLKIISRTYLENEIIIGRLWKKDAVMIRRIIEGLRMFGRENIDTSNYTVDELISKLKELSAKQIEH